MLNLPRAARIATGVAVCLPCLLLLASATGLTAGNAALAVLLSLGGYLLFTGLRPQHVAATAMVPFQMQSALDALTEGVLLLDDQGGIILANSAFAESVGQKPGELLGRKASALGWQFTTTYEDEFPWELSLSQGQTRTGRQLQLTSKPDVTRIFVVKSAPIMDGKQQRGVMVTFDDVTQLEEKNDQLESMLGMLKKSRDEIHRQNRKLKVLATQDPLTNCLNRRSFFEKYESIFAAARRDGHSLSCIMADIDLFKTINDRYGHSKGDEVIKAVADSLHRSIRSSDTLCRYGGEEFCIILPGLDLELATQVAERARRAIEAQHISGISGNSAIDVTASFGVTTIGEGMTGLEEFIDQADQALYQSKRRGRNCTTTWEDAAGGARTARQVTFVPGVACADLPQDAMPVAAGATPAPSRKHVPGDIPAGNPPQPGHDALTGLPARGLFREKMIESLNHCRNNRTLVAIMVLDLDMFTRINKTLGHDIGDALLREVSRRLVDIVRDSDTIARLEEGEASHPVYHHGGDEFGILLTGLESTEFITRIVQRVIDSVTRRIDTGEHEIHLTCSAGISLYPDNGMDADHLLTHAAVALDYAKCQGHNSYQFYDPELSKASLEDLKLENDLRHAAERNELELYYQPKIDLESGEILGMEALLRWNHPYMGMLPPAEFIPLAESSGLITSIGTWVLRAGCEQLRAWQDAGHVNINLAINLSAVEFRQADLIEQLTSILEETAVEAHHLEIEITESMIMEDIDASARIMRILHTNGIHIAIDDFGTGYSSLNHLKRFPISTVKIDRSFVRDITSDSDDAAIIKAIIDMAHSMGLKVIAEGVETVEQLGFLKELHCDEMQGYLCSPPVAAGEALQLLENDSGLDYLADYADDAVSCTN